MPYFIIDKESKEFGFFGSLPVMVEKFVLDKSSLEYHFSRKKEKKFEDDYLFTTERYPGKAMGRVYYANLIKEWCNYLHLDPRNYSTHSIRRTRASIVYKQTGNIEAVRQLLGQKSVTSTSAYLGLSMSQALDIYEDFLD